MGIIYGYGRHSTAKQSITEDAQRDAVEHYIKTRLPEHTYGGWHYDAAVSGKQSLFERPEGLRLWSLVQPGDHIVWAKLDRAFRRVVDGAVTMQMLAAKGVYVHSLDLGIDTSTPVGKLIYTVLLAVAELERDFACQRTRDSLAAKRRAGKPYCPAVPIGWKKRGEGSESSWLPCQQEREHVAEIVRLREDGRSLQDIARIFRRVGTRPNGRYWNKNSISRAVRAYELGFPKTFAAGEEQSRAAS